MLKKGNSVSTIAGIRLTKPQILIDKNGIPIAIGITRPGGSDHLHALSIVDQVKILNGRKGRPKIRPNRLVADKGYASRGFRNDLRKRSIRHQIPPVKLGGGRGNPQNRVLKGRPPSYQPLLYNQRWKVERTIAWFMSFRKINIYTDCLEHMYVAFCTLAATVIALRYF